MLSLHEAITKFAEADKGYKEITADRRELAAILADYAREADATQKTVHLQSDQTGQKIDVEFRTDVEYDKTLMADVAQLLDGKFDDLFETVIIFKPKSRNLKMFLNTVSTSEAENTAKKIIGEARIETPQTPYVHLSKS